jgi:GNAT superfamily N-acetyltransferase
MNDHARLRIETDLAPTAKDLAVVRDGLMAFNDSRAGPVTVERLAVYLRDGRGMIQGGLVGFMAWKWLSIEWLWVGESLRREGYGSALLAEAEAAARDAGCIAAKLDTYEFQAKPFYEKHGYVVFGTLEGYPADTRTYYMRKAL